MQDVKSILEADVVAQVKDVIKLTGIKVQRINTGNFKGVYKSANKGTLDFEGYDKHGRFVGIECKRPCGGRVSPEQAARIADINAKGGLAMIATCGDDVLTKLKENDCF